ncbi:uncharacterized protein EKO05_0008419 [Ascochyta rabiei]|uniref:DUF8035 domain-containing protein n=1 Tax=Didymella rabiei TaxID=5454 RepID=A0A163D9N1_DIDRA|nr:uncharacterized protein EKO05_0008419 [Ascochyta rabiei]KZM23012.1 hypothetical protein ST47_g5638 [Ascochyta rabiei]UPX18103.1 hypothetical protein EKO05_0008419 [Ascochyta rabiei]
MAVLAAILPVVSRSSCLVLELYHFAASSPGEAKDFVKVAKAINNFASILKQVGTIIKEDDRLPSYEALDVLEDVTVQSQTVLKEIENATELRRNEHSGGKKEAPSSRNLSRSGSLNATRLAYLAAHLECLRLTLAVLLQTLYAAQSIMWSKLRPTVSPKQAAKAVTNERIQLQTLIIEQQMSILATSVLHEQIPRHDARFLMEADSSQSLVMTGSENTSPNPNHLFQYQDKCLGSLDTSGSTEDEWLPTVCSVAGARTEQLLERWTSLPDFDHRLRDAERRARTQKHENQQATVESDSEENKRSRYGPNGSGVASHTSQRSGSVQPLFMDTTSLPIPVPTSKFGPSAPISPAASPRASRTTFETPASPHTSIGSLPMEAAAAIEAQEEDEGLELEIPWSLRTSRYEWKYIDGKIVSSNTDLPPSTAYAERRNWTEVMASWVCKEAIQEAGYRFTQVQKERKDGRRTRFDTCFCIEQPLKFDQVKHLVERTVEIYRKNVPATPPQPAPPRIRRTSFDRPPAGPSPSYLAKMAAQDRDRTPTASRPQVPLERSSSTLSYPPPPPPLDRSMSMPGPGMFAPPPYPPSVNSRASNPPLTMPTPGTMPVPMPNGQYSSLPPQSPYSPQIPPPPPNAQQYPYPPPGAPYNNYPYPPHMQPYANPSNVQSPLRQSYPVLRPMDRYDDDSMTSDSGSGERRRRRSKSRRRYDKEGEGRRKKHGKSAAVGTLMGIGGLTALLDGLGGL